MIKRLILLVTLVAFVFALQAQSTPGSQAIAKWKIEDVVRSYSANNDTVYVVNFWATFCKPCIEEIPDFIRIVERYKSQKVKLLLVSVDLPSYYPDRIAGFAKKNNYNTNLVWLDETNADHFCPAIDVKWSGAIPSTIIVNNSNGYRKFVEDQMNAAEFEKAVKEAIGEPAAFKYVSPMNEAEIIDNTSGDFVVFRSDDSAVYAVSGGKVNTIAKIDHMKVIIVEKDKLFYTYSNLGSTTLKTGDEVNADQLIGYAAFDLDGYKPTVDLYISDATKGTLLNKQDFAPRKDLRQVDHSIEHDREPQ
ncbi:MAG: redoxin domain-containing protein [Chitinophagaceae bacterium]|nr:redoxin domain-containing protein [Chitinophagaceae bacterium]